MIVIRLELLGGTYHASDHTLRRHEWPPHPDRIFQALVSANHATGNRAQCRDVLRSIAEANWDLNASDALPRPEMVQYVPRNEDQGGGAGSYNPIHTTSRMKERRLPSVEPIDPVIHYYIDACVDKEALCVLTDAVARLGRTHVSLFVQDTGPKPNWVRSMSGGELRLRVPYSGRLEDLEQAFADGRRAGFRWGSFRRETLGAEVIDQQHNEFREIIVLAASGRGVDCIRVAPLIEAARRSIMSVCNDPLPSWVSGHEPNGSRLAKSHLALLPTLFTGTRGDGRIMGIGLAIPREVTIEESRACLHQVISRGLILAEQNWAVENSRAITTEPATWTRPSRVWVSVSPVEIRRRDFRTPVEIADEWCVRSGLPKPHSAQMRSQPFIKGPSHAATYAPGKRPRLRMHFRIEWLEPVSGPMALGMGRYRGFGMMRPVEDEI